MRISTRLPVLLCVAVCALYAFGGALARAETAAPGWEVTTINYPTNLAPGGKGIVEDEVFNIGVGIPRSRVTVTDILPEGVEATNAGEAKYGSEEGANTGVGIGIEPKKFVESGPQEGGFWECEGTKVVVCTLEPGLYPVAGDGAGGGAPMKIDIAVKVAPEATEGTAPNRVSVSGGGAPTPASTSQPLTIDSTPISSFAFTGWHVWFSNADGTVDTQAGSHPYEAVFSFNLATAFEGAKEDGLDSANSPGTGGELNAIVAKLPPGFVGDPTAVPQCPRADLNPQEIVDCPPSTQIGIILAPIGPGLEVGFEVYNMVPPPGTPAEFGFSFLQNLTFLLSSVRSGSDYGISTIVNNVVQSKIHDSTLILWGYPADPSHNPWRPERNGEVPLGGGYRSGCDEVFPENGTVKHEGCGEASAPSATPQPFLTLPTSCGAPQPFSISAATWEHPNERSEISTTPEEADGNSVGFTGCEDLVFHPAITLAPDTSYADTPAGLTVEVKPPIGGLTEVEGLSPSDVQNTKVVLPQGLSVNPGQAAGLKACGPAEDGLTTQAEKEKGEEDTGPPSCPSASKVGTVSIETPLLKQKLEGGVYVMPSNPPNLELLVATYAEGVNVKLVGKVHLDESTGQLTSTFEGTPELPFTDFKLSFTGGAQAALATPTQCGTYTSDADFAPWSSPFLADFLDENSFAIASGPGGAPCPSAPLPFSPSLIAGATTDQAGGYTDFSLLLQRGDGQQRIDGLQFKAPEGLTGFLSNVTLCTNAQAEANACPAASKIGHTVVESGPGPYPLVVPEPGQEPAPIYLTEAYDGAPFGLSIVVPLHVGPFTLPTQRVRAKIEVNPYTSALTVTTNPLPQVVAGVPTDLREIDAVIERPEFMVNPTNCDPQEFTGTAYGTAPPGQNEPGSEAHISSHFQVGACRSLEFAPKFSASTGGKASKSDGASLTVKVSYPNVPQGTDADIGYVKVELPKALPSRLTTLQKACTNAQFEANPAACPAESKIGYAVVHTQLLPVPLEGPAIFVSHGGEAFPSLEIVLQGDGVTVDLVGTTFISKAGITSTTFKTVPDDPFSTFELTLPTGPYSALATNLPHESHDLCGQKLTMPTEFIGQNGAAIEQSTDIAVAGCAPAITVVSQRVKGETATIQVSVPAAGKLVATGKGLSKASKTAKGASTLTVTLAVTNAEAAFLGRHKNRKLKATIKLQFTPKKGDKLKTTTTVLID